MSNETAKCNDQPATERSCPDPAGLAFTVYMLKKSDKETAYARYNHASVALENAQIKERLAEIKSQHEPLSSLAEQPLSERDRLYAAAYYVVVGRLPNVKVMREGASEK